MIHAIHHKHIRILAVFVWVSLACNALLPPFATVVPVPTIVNSHEIPNATPIPASTIVKSLEIPNARIEYYDVSGSTEREIRDQLNTLSPVDENGYRGDALTRWEIRWNWDGYGTETCDLSSVTARYMNTVLLPRWTAPENAHPELILKWNAYMLALVEHEKGHVDMVVAYLPEIIQAIQAATCDTAESRAQEIISQLRLDHLNYDQETNHGGSQGAIFP